MKNTHKSLLKLHYVVTYKYIDDVEFYIKNASNDVDIEKFVNNFFCLKDLANKPNRFEKCSILHEFIAFIVEYQFYEEMGIKGDVIEDSLVHDPSFVLWPCELFNAYNIQHTDLNFWLKTNDLDLNSISEENILDYYQQLKAEGALNRLCYIIAEEVFFLLFMNRNLLKLFNEILAKSYCKHKINKHKRVYIPKWVQKAVYLRDGGKCVKCNRDLTGTVNIPNANFDHIVPLNRFGFNDISNIQLLCSNCNNEKRDKPSYTENLYERWYC
jgi:hypothetical protein